jgi:hypothetical protein
MWDNADFDELKDFQYYFPKQNPKNLHLIPNKKKIAQGCTIVKNHIGAKRKFMKKISRL